MKTSAKYAQGRNFFFLVKHDLDLNSDFFSFKVFALYRLARRGFENIDLDESGPVDLNSSFSSTSSRGSRRSVQFQPQPRIALSSRLLVEMLHSIYFIMSVATPSESSSHN